MAAWEGWVVVIVMAAGTFALRFSVLGAMGDRRFPPWLERALALVLPAIFAAIVTPMLLHVEGDFRIAENAPKLVAALVAMLIAIRMRSYLVPLLAGMAVLHLSQWALRMA